MAGQSQQCRSALGLEGLGEMGLIHDQQGARTRQLIRQASPADQFRVEINRLGFSSPMGMQTHRSHHHQAHVAATDHGPCRQQSGERLAKTHLIGQNSAPAGQQPTGTRPLMGQGGPPIRQSAPQISLSHQPAVGRQGRKGMVTPVQPLLQLGCHRKTSAQCRLQSRRCRQRKVPSLCRSTPMTLGPNAPQLCLRDGIKRTHHPDQSGW